MGHGITTWNHGSSHDGREFFTSSAGKSNIPAMGWAHASNVASQQVAFAHLDTKDVFGGVPFQERPLRRLALQEVGGQRHLSTRHVRSQALAHPPASVQWKSNRGGEQGRHSNACKHELLSSPMGHDACL